MSIFKNIIQSISDFLNKIFSTFKSSKQDDDTQKISYEVTERSEDFLQSKRKICDPIADRAVAKIIEQNSIGAINTLMRNISHNNDTINMEGLPDEVVTYFKQTEHLPDWADEKLIKEGEEVYLKHAGSIAFLLCFKSLPECYVCAKGSMVLYYTGRLNEHKGSLDAFTRRIVETAQFVVNMMSPGGLSSRGKGIISAQKVRLIHACIRHYLRHSGWDADKYDEPINQEDLTGTLMSFSALVLEGLDMLGIKLTQREKEAYIHCWNIAGYIMGVNEDLLPKNPADAHSLGYAILNHQKQESEQGKVLTKALVDFTHSISANNILHELSDSMMRYLLTDEIADMLGVPKVDPQHEKEFSESVIKLMEYIQNIEEHSMIEQLLARVATKSLVEGMLKHMNKEEDINFFLPPSLTQDWEPKI